ncbi:hypothetical protein DPMN_097505 [Dreissena polymorpha]|uniref:Uncharacterized protein n=1 Tax=Dreissena polymorpha TaxID=45954 RepID=A0A9D4LAD9_DREPO|nr:hypothetical protein DPMN_097505 [Dreissena polymorpha]
MLNSIRTGALGHRKYIKPTQQYCSKLIEMRNMDLRPSHLDTKLSNAMHGFAPTKAQTKKRRIICSKNLK